MIALCYFHHCSLNHFYRFSAIFGQSEIRMLLTNEKTDLEIPLITLITRSQFIAAIKRNDPIMQIFNGFSMS